MWNDRSSDAGDAYGTEPNDFLVAERARLPARGEALALAEGEGRNAGWLAAPGPDVLAVGQSSVGLEKARALASERRVTLQTVSTWRERSASPLLVALSLGAVLTACKRPFDDSAALRRGPTIIDPFRKELMATLQTAMAKGPVHAVDVCAVEAPAIAARSAPPGVRLGRASSRLRNGTNAAPAWVAPLLAELEKERAPGGTPRAVQLPADRVGYVSAIAVVPLCLTCHGKVVDPAVKARLDERYPGDRATGYELGDFRGVFWAEFPSR